MIDRWTAVLAELERMRSLKDDWDGEGTLAPEAPMIEAAIYAANLWRSSGFEPPDRVHVGVNATIYFEWHSDGGYREIEFATPSLMTARLVPNKAKLEASHV